MCYADSSKDTNILFIYKIGTEKYIYTCDIYDCTESDQKFMYPC